MNTEISTRVIRVIAEHAFCSEDQAKPEQSFRDDLHFDSLDEVELVMALEEEFEIEISDDDAEKVKTVGEAIALVERLMKVEHPDIPLEPVESSQISAAGYADGTLAIKFKSGGLYHYTNFPVEKWQEFRGASSAGQYFSAHIKHLPFIKVEGRAA